LRASYDTYGNDKGSDDFVEDFRKLKRGSIIIVGVKDEASAKFSAEAKAVFAKMGSKAVSELKYRQAWAFIGVKGQDGAVEKAGETAGTGVIIGYA